MVEYSIIELIVYGAIGYFGIILMMSSILANPPTNRSLAGARSLFLMPSVVCLSLLMFSDGGVTLDTLETDYTEYNGTDDSIISYSNSTETRTYTLVNPFWGTIHFGFFIIEIVYILMQVLNILFKPE